MYKISLLTIIALCTFAVARAQQNRTPGMEMGVHGGPGFSLFYNEHPKLNPRDPNKLPYGSAVFGLGWQYNFKKIVSLRVEGNFERKGDVLYTSSHYYELPEGEIYYLDSYGFEKLNYFSIPVMTRLSFGRRVQFFTDIGLYAGFLTGAYRVSSDADYTSSSPFMNEYRTTTDVYNSYRKVDGGLVTGLGLNIPFWRRAAFTFEVRNNLGFANLNNETSPNYANRFYNNSTNFLFGLNFMLSKPGSNELKYKAPDDELRTPAE